MRYIIWLVLMWLKLTKWFSETKKLLHLVVFSYPNKSQIENKNLVRKKPAISYIPILFPPKFEITKQKENISKEIFKS